MKIGYKKILAKLIVSWSVSLLCVYVTCQNIGLGKPSFAWPYYGGLIAPNCFDGNYYSRHGGNALCHTGNAANAWFRVELGAVYHVRTAVVINRDDCCTTRIGTSAFHVGNSTDPGSNPHCATFTDGGFFDCDLWGSHASVRRFVAMSTE